VREAAPPRGADEDREDVPAGTSPVPESEDPVNAAALRRSLALVVAVGVVAVPSALAGGSHHDGHRGERGDRHGSSFRWGGHDRASHDVTSHRSRGERSHRWSGERGDRSRTRGGGCSRHQDPPADPPADPPDPPVDPPVDPPDPPVDPPPSF
jgi:hypothetical protein